MTKEREIERKWILPAMPNHFLLGEATNIRQGYLKSANGSDGEIRLRHNARVKKFFLSSKKGNGLVREENEVEIDESMFEALWPMTAGARLEKWRFSFLDEPHLFLDVCCGDLTGYFFLEREFSSVSLARAYTLPAWVGEAKEVTGHKLFTSFSLANNSLAKRAEVE